jgi:hypothetical protein
MFPTEILTHTTTLRTEAMLARADLEAKEARVAMEVWAAMEVMESPVAASLAMEESLAWEAMPGKVERADRVDREAVLAAVEE